MPRRSFLQSSAAMSVAAVHPGRGSLDARGDEVSSDPIARLPR